MNVSPDNPQFGSDELCLVDIAPYSLPEEGFPLLRPVETAPVAAGGDGSPPAPPPPALILRL